MPIKKGYNNDSSWEKINSEDAKTYRVNNVMNPDEHNNHNNVHNMDFNENNSDREENEEINSENNDSEITQAEEFFKEDKEEDFSDVLQLTEYNDSMLPSKGGEFIIAEYNEINVTKVSKSHEITAKKFVSKITQFILDFNDVTLSEQHKSYIKDVGKLQLSHLSDLLYLTDVNKQLLNNIINRINATQAEDYAILQSYNNIANQHLKLIKELQNTYRSIPSVMKKMKAEILCNQELGSSENPSDEVMTSDFGTTQFTNSKQMLKAMLEKRNAEKNKDNQPQ